MGTIAGRGRRLWWCPVLFAHAQAFAFGIDDLRQLVRQEGLSSVAAIVERLPREHRENYTLVYDSRSLQGASYENPRAILFGGTAGLVLSFNGDPSQRRYNTIEAMQFREASESFELYAIEVRDGETRISAPNPGVCTSCHGSPPRPIWSSYEYGDRAPVHWPGFYGSTHDAPVLNANEKAAFEGFRERAASHPRYRHLVLSNPGAPWFPYATGPTQHRFRPNNRLGNLLARRHARQIVALIRRGGFIDRRPHLTRAWLLQCPGTQSPSYRRRVRELFNIRFPRVKHRHIHSTRDALPLERRTAFMLERLLTGRVDLGWGMNVGGPAQAGAFDTGIVTIDRLVAARWMATLDNAHPLKRYYEPWTSRQLYNTFADGYYESNVAPGGVGAAYDQVLGYFDARRARLACPVVTRSFDRATGW